MNPRLTIATAARVLTQLRGDRRTIVLVLDNSLSMNYKAGDETRLETVPLCTACAAAIGMTALARWEIEEEEG